MGLFDGVFGPSGVGDILKAVTNPVGTAGGAVGKMLKDSGLIDEIGKIMDGAVKKPGGLSGLGDKIKKLTEGMMPPPPTGLLDTPGFGQGGYGGKLAPPGYGGMQGNWPAQGGKVGQAGYGGKGGAAGGYGGGGAKGAEAGYGGGAYSGKGGQAGYGGGGGAGYGGGGTYASKGAQAGYGGGGGAAGYGGGMGDLATAAQKAMFIATLQKVIQDVASKPKFDMNRAIQDVWTQVSYLRAQQEMNQVTQTFQVMEQMMRQMHDMQKNVIGNIRG